MSESMTDREVRSLLRRAKGGRASRWELLTAWRAVTGRSGWPIVHDGGGGLVAKLERAWRARRIGEAAVRRMMMAGKAKGES